MAHLAINDAHLVTDVSNHLYVCGRDQPRLRQLMIDHSGFREKMDDASKFAKAKVVWAARFEVTRTVEDVLSRWVRVLFLDSIVVICIALLVAKLLSQELGRNAKW